MKKLKTMAEDKEKLWTGESSRARTIMLGAANVMKNWPGKSEVPPVLLAGCILTTALVFLAFVPLIIAHQHPSNTCRLTRGNSKKPANVYFLKHENRTWTTEELCNIEAAARLHPEYNVFLINLEKRGDRGGTLVSRVSKGRRKISVRNEGSSESRTRRELSRMSNVENVNVGLEKFFHGSVVSKKIGQLTVDKLELAAKFHAIWEAPGIALDPLNAHQLSSVARLFNSSRGDPLAGVQMDGDLQAASVACHSFVGLVNREISKSGVPERRTVLKRALLNFCSSLSDCTGVRIVQPVAGKKPPENSKDCPIVRSVDYGS